MPKATFRDPKRIYISWDLEPEHDSWIERFRKKLKASAETCELRWTNDTAVSKVIDVDQTLSGVTDMVAVLTDEYLIANQDPASAQIAPELAKFIDLQSADEGDSGCRRAWLAPLQRCTFRRHRIGNVRLDEDHLWLIRLRKDGEVFVSQPLDVADREIYEAVETIIDQVEA